MRPVPFRLTPAAPSWGDSRAERGESLALSAGVPRESAREGQIDWKQRLPRLRRTAIWAAMAGVGIYALAGVVLDGGRLTGQSLPPLRHPLWLALVLLMAPLNYALRFAKWQMYGRRLGLHQVPWRGSLTIFLAGFGLTITPGKVGELVKSWFLWDRYGVPAARTAPMVFADRLTDGCAMLVLATAGAAWLGRGPAPYALMAAAAVIVVLVQSRRAAMLAVRIVGRVGRLAPLRDKVVVLLDSARTLLLPLPFLAALGLGIVGWGLEGLIVYFVLTAFHWPFSLAASVLVVATAAIAGTVSALPGGIGAAEGVMIALLMWLRVPLPLAVLATLVMRFATLWLGLGIGLVALGSAQAGADRARACATGPRGGPDPQLRS